MHRDINTQTSIDTSTSTSSGTGANGGGGFGVWTEAFTELHHAATTGAPPAEVDRLAAPAAPPGGEWRERGACAETDPEAFFPDRGGSTRAAKRVCAGCPVRVECLAAALQLDERHGVWGGTTPAERARLRRAQRAGGRATGSGRGTSSGRGAGSGRGGDGGRWAA